MDIFHTSPKKNKFHPLFLEDIPIHTFQDPQPTFDTLRVNHLDSLDSQASAREGASRVGEDSHIFDNTACRK